MSNERKHIDDYFADALEEQSNEDLDLNLNWNAIESKLDKFSFFKFQLNRFNAYYLGGIFLSIAVVLFIKIDRQENSLPSTTNTANTTSADISGSGLVLQSASKTNAYLSSHSKKNTEKHIKENYNETPALVFDPLDTGDINTVETSTLATIAQQEVVKKTDSLEHKRIKPPVVINRKRDTIVKVDTVYVNKKKKKK